jgi:Zn-dependent M28 family amino/carboxypeptidase
MSSALSDFRLVSQISQDRLKRRVYDLSTRWPTRHTLSRHHAPCAAYLQGVMAGLGLKKTAALHTYQAQGKTCYNVIGELGPKNPRSSVLFCAHFDSRQERIDQPEAPAPGANDNATGVAALLEVALLLRGVALKDRVVFALFSGEEQALWGSTAYARVPQKPPLRFVFNLDQIGYPPQTGEKSLFVDVDERGRPDNNDASKKLVARCVELARTVVRVPTRTDPVEGSDYIPFEKIGVPVLGLYEGEYRYPHYHKSTDTASKVDYAYLADMTRLTMAFLLDQCT